MLASGVYKFRRIFLFILTVVFLSNGCSFSNKEIKLLLIHDVSSGYIANQLTALCRQQGFALQKTTDLSYCDEDSLKRYNAIILDIPIDSLDRHQQLDLERYVLAGGGLLGMDLQTRYKQRWPWIENFLQQKTSQQKNRPVTLLSAAKSSNEVEGITTNYGPGRVCFIDTHPLNTVKKKLTNAVAYTINPGQVLRYQQVALPRLPSAVPFSDVVIAKDLSEPVDMEVLPRGHVIFIERRGVVKFFNFKTHETKPIARFNVNKENGFGLTAVALDPDFNKNHWIYFGYTPLADPHQQYVSRFFLAEDSLILRTEKVLFKMPAEASVLSLIEFDEERNLLAGFSNTLPDAKTDEAPNPMIYGRQQQVLKLRLQPDTTLQVSLAKVNDDSTDRVAAAYLPASHPRSLGFSDKMPYSRWGGASISQDSSSNANPAYGQQYRLPYLSAGNYFITGPIYYADPHSTSVNKFPAYYANKLFIADAASHRLLLATLGQDKQLHVIEPFQETLDLNNPVRLKFASDGSLYVLEQGPGGYISHQNARLRRITYARKNRPPVARISANKKSGKLPLTVNFSAQASFDYDPHDSLHFEWIFPDTVIYTSTNLKVQYTFNEAGVYEPLVKVYDQAGAFNEASTKIVAGNAKPEIFFDTDVNRSFYWKSSTLPYKIKITDAEDGLNDSTVLLANVKLYEHPRQQWYATAPALPIAPEGDLKLQAPAGDSLKDYTLEVKYTDRAANGVAANNTEAVFPVRSPQLYATSADDNKNVLMRVDQQAWFTQNESYILFKDIDMREINHLKYRIKPLVDGYVELRLNAPNGPVVSTFRISSKEDWAAYTVRVGQIEGSYDLYFVFRQSEESLGAPRLKFCVSWSGFILARRRKATFISTPMPMICYEAWASLKSQRVWVLGIGN